MWEIGSFEAFVKHVSGKDSAASNTVRRGPLTGPLLCQHLSALCFVSVVKMI